MEKKVTIYKVSAQAIMKVTESLRNRNGPNEYIARYTGFSPKYTRKCLEFAIQLGLVKACEGQYRLTAKARQLFQDFGNNYELIFKKVLFVFRPFRRAVDQLLENKSPHDAVRETKAFYDINSNCDLLKVFNNFCQYAGLGSFNKENLKDKNLCEPVEISKNSFFHKIKKVFSEENVSFIKRIIGFILYIMKNVWDYMTKR